MAINYSYLELFIKNVRSFTFLKTTKKLSVDQQNALSAGLIIAEQNMFCWNSLESDTKFSDKIEQKYRLGTTWGFILLKLLL